MKLRPHRVSLAPLGSADHAHDPTPLYFKLETILRAAIESREYPPGTSFPSERELGELYGVSRITVRRALDTLGRAGLIRRGRGRHGGTFVLDAPAPAGRGRALGSLDRVVSRRQITRIDVLALDVRPCAPEIATRLGLPSEERIRYVERLMFTPDGPVAHARNFLPLPVGGPLRRGELRTMLLRDALVKRHDVKLVEVQDEVEACLAESRVAAMLRVRPGSALLRLRRLFVAAAGEPVNFTILLVRDTYRMSVTLSDETFG